MIQDTQAYIIKSKHSGKVLQIGKQQQLKGNAVIYKYQNGFHQQFYLRQNGPLIEIINGQSKRALTVTDGSLNNGQDKGLDWQKFRFQQVSPESNQYIIYTFCGKVLDCFEYSRSNGTNVVQWEFNGGDNQKWILEKLKK